jgi:hypothetical protein
VSIRGGGLAWRKWPGAGRRGVMMGRWRRFELVGLGPRKGTRKGLMMMMKVGAGTKMRRDVGVEKHRVGIAARGVKQ